MTARPLSPFAALVRHPVEDFDRWKRGFDAHEPERRAASIVGHHINVAADDPNHVTLFLPLTDLDRAKAFAASDDLRQYTQSIGVTAPPEITWVEPKRQAPVWDRQLPAFILTHRVADFDAWLAGFDAAADLQREHGIIGIAANRLLDDPSVAMVYHQAETFEDLEEFLNLAELKEAMQEAGVISEPEVSFHLGGWGKRYD